MPPRDATAGARIEHAGREAERFVVLNLRLMAIGFALTGFFFIAWPDGTLARLTEFGDNFGDFTPAPETDERLWLSLGFAYMVVITALAWIASTDPVRHRPMLLALAAGKAASSITSLIFFFEDDVFVYLLNGIVDGSLVGASLLLYVARRPDRALRPRPAEGARRGSGPPSSGRCARSPRRSRPADNGLPAAEARGPGRRAGRPLPRPAARPHRAASCGSPCALFEWLPFPWRFSRLGVEARSEYLAKMERSRFAPYRDLLLLAKLLAMIGWARDERVRTVVGYEAPLRRPRGRARPAETPPLGDLRPPGDGEDCDVAIVGSGAGGAAAAAVLAEAGLDVLVLESGPHVDHASYPTDPLEGLPLLYRDGGMTIASGKPAIPVPVGRTVGGTTVINSGTCFRAPAEVLRRMARRRGLPGRPSSTRSTRRPRRCWRSPRSTPSAWGETASSAWRAPRRSAPAAGRSPATPAPASSAAPARSAAGSTRSAPPTSPTCRGRSRPAPASAPGSRSSGCSPRAAGSPGSPAAPGCRPRPPRKPPATGAPAAVPAATGRCGPRP